MLTKTNKNYSIILSPVRIAVFLQIIICVFVLGINAQKTAIKKDNLPAWQSYKGIGIGTTADEVRAKLGVPKSEDAEGVFYVFSEMENAQFLFDNEKKVRTVSVVFDAAHPTPPTFADVFGKTAQMAAKPDGSIFKMMRYEDAGYWISYSRMAGDKAMVIVMIQKF